MTCCESIIYSAISGVNEQRPPIREHPFYKYVNLVKELPVTRPNQVWVSDITYIRTGRDFSYLSLITDAYSHKIMGWALDTTLQTKGPLAALQMALKTLPKGKEGLIHHSDRGTGVLLPRIYSTSLLP